MKITKRIHNGWKEWQEAKRKGFSMRCMFGKYQYLYEFGDAMISLVYISVTLDNKFMWEICCLKGNLFEDVIRFNTKKEAEEYIKEKFK